MKQNKKKKKENRNSNRIKEKSENGPILIPNQGCGVLGKHPPCIKLVRTNNGGTLFKKNNGGTDSKSLSREPLLHASRELHYYSEYSR
jgi:hypothetical protein